MSANDARSLSRFSFFDDLCFFFGGSSGSVTWETPSTLSGLFDDFSGIMAVGCRDFCASCIIGTNSLVKIGGVLNSREYLTNLSIPRTCLPICWSVFRWGLISLNHCSGYCQCEFLIVQLAHL